MATYAIGDVHGCFAPLERLLDQLNFDPAKDNLWFAGDLVNRGPDSLATLRFVRALGSSAITVLGNHDIHLLAIYYGLRSAEKDPTLAQVLEAPDVDELIHWLQCQPLLHVQRGFALVHAGIHPHWNLKTATTLAAEIETQLRRVDSKDTLSKLYGPSSNDWQVEKNTDNRLRFAVNAFTRMRFCNTDCVLDFKHSCAPGEQPSHLKPWFEVQHKLDETVLFGHWAALGAQRLPGYCALDSGCVWGNTLTALDLDSLQLHHASCEKG